MAKTDPRGFTTKYTYNPDNTLVRIDYPDGGAVQYVYDKLANFSETSPLGALTTHRYNAFGKEKTVIDPYGKTVETRYDLSGNAVSVKDKRGSVSVFKFDGNNRLTEKDSA